MAGFENNVMVAKNMNFDPAAAKPHLGAINAAGKLPIGTGQTSPIPEILGGNLISPNGTITISYISPNITLDVEDAGFVWVDQSGTFTAEKNKGYFITATATANLPASPSQGDTIKFFVDHASQVLTIDAPGTQIIRMGSAVTAAGGTAVSTAQGDSVELTYRASDTCWCAIAGFSGIWVVT